ncbi:MAG: hypothetical protein JXA66_04155 [Oligoflexia bacterium]|nr:hypothetical protein [Oligoflexia bacterium]
MSRRDLKFPVTACSLLFLCSCSPSGKSYWKEWTTKSLIKPDRVPISLLLYSSLDPPSSRLLNDKKLARALSDFSLYSIDIETAPYAIRRYGGQIPCISFLDRNGNSYFMMEKAGAEKLIPLVPKLLELGKATPGSLPVAKSTDNMSSDLLFPGEEREISETIIKNIKKHYKSGIPVELLSYAYRESGDAVLRKILVSELISMLSSNYPDPVGGGIWSRNGYVKRLDRFAQFALEVNSVASFCKNCENIIADIIEKGLGVFESSLKREDKLFNAGMIFNEPFNLVLTEKILINKLGVSGVKNLENIFTLSYPKMGRGKRYVMLSYRVDKNPKQIKSAETYIDEIKQSVFTDDSYTTGDFVYLFPNILMSRLYVNLSINDKEPVKLEKALELKQLFYEKLKNPSGLLNSSENSYPYLRDQVEYVKLLIDIYNKTLKNEYLEEAISFSKMLLKSFCEEWQKVAFCSDLPFDILKTENGYFSIPDYSIKTNSELALALLQLHSLTNEETFFRLSQKILSAFKDKVKIMMKNTEINPSLYNYTKALISLYTNPLKIYLSMPGNFRNREVILRKFKKDIYSASYPVMMLKITDSSDRSIIVCLGETCKKSSSLSANLTKFIEDFLDENKDKVVRTLPYW